VVVTSPETRINSMQTWSCSPGEAGGAELRDLGNGGSTHLAGAMLEELTGTKMINVPFKGNGPALAEVMAGRVTFMFYPSSASQTGSGEETEGPRVGRSRPHADFPRCPRSSNRASRDSRRPRPGWACSLPPERPAPAVNRLAEDMRKSLARRETQERMKALGAVTVADTPFEFAAFLKKDYERWARVIKTPE